MKYSICVLAVAFAALSGCSSTKYVNESITDPAKVQKQMSIDDGECLRQAYGAASPNQAIDTTRTNGSGFAGGFNNAGGNDIGNAYVRGKIYQGCMLSKGWSKQPK